MLTRTQAPQLHALAVEAALAPLAAEQAVQVAAATDQQTVRQVQPGVLTPAAAVAVDTTVRGKPLAVPVS